MDEVSLWVSPVVLVSGVGLLILSTSARYGQLHAELRELMRDSREGTIADDAAAMLYVHLRTRTRLLLSALFGLYLSVGFLITGSLVGVLSAIGPFSTAPVIALTCAGILSVIFAALQLVRESRMFLRTVDTCSSCLIGPRTDDHGATLETGSR